MCSIQIENTAGGIELLRDFCNDCSDSVIEMIKDAQEDNR
jgi:hypothetical protein